MSRYWPRGSAALVTSRSIGAEYLAIRTADGWVAAHRQIVHSDVAEVRPLVVIDPEDREQVERLARALPVDWELFDDDADRDEDGRNEDSVDEVQAALREFANPTPPKPDEPTGLCAVVEDSNGDKWVRMAPRIADFDWFNADDHARSRAYRNIAAVKVLSDGVQP